MEESEYARTAGMQKRELVSQLANLAAEGRSVVYPQICPYGRLHPAGGPAGAPAPSRVPG